MGTGYAGLVQATLQLSSRKEQRQEFTQNYLDQSPKYIKINYNDLANILFQIHGNQYTY